MILSRFLPLFLLIATTFSVKAVEIVTTTNSYFNTTDNISLALPSWASGWGSGNTNNGWNYLGQVNGASGTYLGNGWVLTAGHVGAGSFTLNGNTYNSTGYSYSSFTYNSTNTADLTLFKISTTSTTGNTLSLSALTLASNAPTPFSGVQSGSTNVMVGYGGGSESWGINTVTANNTPVTVSGYSFLSVDYVTAHGTVTAGAQSITNNAELIGGDSGGGNFINVSGSWQLAGINEGVDTSGNSYLVQLDYYQAQIKSVMAAVPEPGTWAFLGLGLSALLSFSFLKNRKRDS
jgi:hypothetical protein